VLPFTLPLPSDSAAATADGADGAGPADAADWTGAACWARRCPLPDCPRGCWAANASLSLRTTGASIVEDADRTNSPISVSLAMTALLSTPNSFASS
jgi:hypothetical protein